MSVWVLTFHFMNPVRFGPTIGVYSTEAACVTQANRFNSDPNNVTLGAVYACEKFKVQP
jgi:hypothetical protein